MKFAAVWERFAAWGAVMRPSWDSTQATHQPHLLAFFGERHVEAITLATVNSYRLLRSQQLTAKGTTVTAATRNREVHSLTACLKWNGTRLRDVPVERERKKHRPYMSPGQMGLLRDALIARGNVEAADVLVFAYPTGLRPIEIHALTWPDVDKHPGSVLVRDTKNGEDRLVPLMPVASAVIARQDKRCHKVFGIKQAAAARQIREAAKAIGMDLRLYSARSGCATNLRRAGADWLVVKAILGHKSDKAAQAYQWVDEEEQRAAMVAAAIKGDSASLIAAPTGEVL